MVSRSGVCLGPGRDGPPPENETFAAVCVGLGMGGAVLQTVPVEVAPLPVGVYRGCTAQAGKRRSDSVIVGRAEKGV